jgi:hypothetical protein
MKASLSAARVRVESPQFEAELVVIEIRKGFSIDERTYPCLFHCS